MKGQPEPAAPQQVAAQEQAALQPPLALLLLAADLAFSVAAQMVGLAPAAS